MTAVTATETGSEACCSGGSYGSTPTSTWVFFVAADAGRSPSSSPDDMGLPAPLCPLRRSLRAPAATPRAARGIAESGVEPTGCRLRCKMADTSVGNGGLILMGQAFPFGDPEVLRPRQGQFTSSAGSFFCTVLTGQRPSPRAARDIVRQRGEPPMPSFELLRDHLAQAERHIAELRGHIAATTARGRAAAGK